MCALVYRAASTLVIVMAARVIERRRAHIVGDLLRLDEIAEQRKNKYGTANVEEIAWLFATP